MFRDIQRNPGFSFSFTFTSIVYKKSPKIVGMVFKYYLLVENCPENAVKLVDL